MKRLILLSALLLSCNGDNGGKTTTTVPVCEVWSAPDGCSCPVDASFAPVLGVCAPPRVDRAVDWGAVRGVTAFSLAMRNIRSIADFSYWVHEHGWTTLRVGAQTSHDWCRDRALKQAVEMGDEIFDRMMKEDLLFCDGISGLSALRAPPWLGGGE